MQLNQATYNSFVAITPSDSTLINCRGFMVTVAGAVAISIDASTTAVVIGAGLVGIVIPIELKGGRIMSTGTTATGIVALQ